MERREFVKKSVRAAGMAALIPSTIQNTWIPFDKTSNDDPVTLLKALSDLNDQQIPHWLNQQEKDKSNKWYGGFKDSNDIYIAGQTANIIRNLTIALTYDQSIYFHTRPLFDSLNMAMDYMSRAQYQDGTIDLPTTNFHSPPDTAFAVEPLCIAYQLLFNEALAETEPLRDKIKLFLNKAGTALSIGGIHTANHRWVVCMALSRLNHLFPDKRYRKRINQWLNEKMDIDPDGQYSEKSVSIYSPLVNRCLITIARFENKPELYEYVRINLDMTLYYLHPNGEIVTEVSGRQDQYHIATPENYYYAYRYMGLMDTNQLYVAMTQYIELRFHDKLLFWLGYMLEDPFIQHQLPEANCELPENYIKEFIFSDLIRIRREQMDASILGDNSVFFTFSTGDAVLQAIRLSSAFFGKGQFVGKLLKKEGDTYVLKQSLSASYMQPLDKKEIPDDGDWNKMDRDGRDKTELQFLETEIIIREVKGGFELTFGITGTENVPVAIEFAFRKEGKFEGVIQKEGIESSFLAGNEAFIKYSKGDDIIQIGPVFREHSWTQLRGAMPKLDADCLYLTGITPFDKKINILAVEH